MIKKKGGLLTLLFHIIEVTVEHGIFAMVHYYVFLHVYKFTVEHDIFAMVFAKKETTFYVISIKFWCSAHAHACAKHQKLHLY
jgi:hypothetical protein